MKQGDIYLVQLPSTDGREQAGQRPAIILQEEYYSQRLPTVLIVPLTSKLGALRFPGTMIISPDERNNFDQESVALAFQLRAIDQKKLTSKSGEITSEQLRRLQSLIRDLMGTGSNPNSCK